MQTRRTTCSVSTIAPLGGADTADRKVRAIPTTTPTTGAGRRVATLAATPADAVDPKALPAVDDADAAGRWELADRDRSDAAEVPAAAASAASARALEVGGVAGPDGPAVTSGSRSSHC